MNKGCKVEMTLFGDVVYCQTWNVTCKIAQKVTLYCCFKFMLSEYNYIHFTWGLMY